MPTVLIEKTVTGTLQFEFSDKWQVYKYDEPIKDNFYDHIKHQGLKAVDFIALSENSVLFIEVKKIIAENEGSCRMRLSAKADNEIIENVTDKVTPQLTLQEKRRIKVISKRPYLAEEVIKKAKDTILGLLASYYQNDTKLFPYHQAVFVDKKPIMLILFLEQTENFNQEEQFKPLASDLKLAIKQKTGLLCTKVDVINSLTIPEILGIKVSAINIRRDKKL